MKVCSIWEITNIALVAPTLWNMLPSSVRSRSVENIAKFHHILNILYNLAYIHVPYS